MNLSNFESNLKTASTKEQIESILNIYLSDFGIHCYAFTYYAKHIKTGSKLHYDCVSDALKPWHIYYLEQGYADVDRTLEQNHQMTLPLYWDVKEQLTQAKNTRERRIREESLAFGIDKGLSLPVHGPHNDFATLTLHQRKDENCLAEYQSLKYEWLSATQILYHYLKKILNSHQNSNHEYHLTKRELQCVSLTSKLFRVEQIAKELNISERTVNFHLQNANKKLGTHNKYQTVYKYFS